MRSSKNWTLKEIRRISASLIGKKISEVANKRDLKNKGGIGIAIETDVFQLKNNNSSLPDFDNIGVELKVIPLKIIRGTLVPKERMILSMINYMEDYKHSFYNSHVYNKCKRMQIIQYNHDYNDRYNSKIIDQFLYTFPKTDIGIIKNDYENIINKIKSGQAHNLSEGDTLYLGAARKGSGNNNDWQVQPFSNLCAKSRAYSLKTSYLRLMNQRRVKTNESVFTFTELLKHNFSFEKILVDKLSKYKGICVNKLYKTFSINSSAKQANELLVSKMLGLKCKLGKSEEFLKANIIPKTVRIINGKIKEHMSFSTIDFIKVSNNNWNEYSLKLKFDNSKFAFLIFEGTNKKNLRFRGIKIWNMPKKDIDAYGYVFNNLKSVSSIVGAVTHNGHTYEYNFPKPRDNRIGHVRPKAKNSQDTVILPNGEKCPKQAFWLNSSYIKKIIN